MKKLLLLFFLLPFSGFAQLSVGLEGQLGYSRPTGIEYSWRTQAYKVGGILSQSIKIFIDKKIKKHHIGFKSGVTILGFQIDAFDGIEEARDFGGNIYLSPVMRNSEYRSFYFDNALCYDYEVTNKIRVGVALHYLKNFIYRGDEFIHTSYNNINMQSSWSGSWPHFETWLEPNHFALSGNVNYKITRHIQIGLSYLTGLHEFSNNFVKDRKQVRLHQNFSISLSQNIWTFKKL